MSSSHMSTSLASSPPPPSSSSSSTTAAATTEEKFGDDIPYGDPYWYQGSKSPFYQEHHSIFRQKVRDFVENHVKPFVSEWEERGEYPRELHAIAYRAGVLGAPWPQQYGGTPPSSSSSASTTTTVPFDAFHDLIMVDELSRCGGGGILWALFFSLNVALHPILRYGTEDMKQRIAKSVITGEKIMSLAVTEPYVGSDVAQLQTTAVKQGDFYIVNGEKKFITSGTRAHYFTVAVRTGNDGLQGVTLLLIEAERAGVQTRKMKTQGMWTSGTAYVTFEDVKVPQSHVIGTVNDGFKLIMHDFNHERFQFAAFSNRFARVCLEEAITYARQRHTFNKRLIDHQIIRHKIATMASSIESTHAWLEQLAYHMNQGVSDRAISGPLALLKVQATKTLEYCAREASQICGGASYLRDGKGCVVERLYREVRFCAIAGGSEEVMLDLAAKQAKL